LRYVLQNEARLADELIRRQIFREVRGERLKNAVRCFCPDRYRHDHICSVSGKKFEEAHGLPFNPQDVQVHGGPITLVYAPESIFQREVERAAVMKAYLYQLAVGVVAMDLAQIELILHWPCGQLLIWGFSFMHSLELLTHAGDIVRTELPAIVEVVARQAGKSAPSEIDVAKHCHLDFGGQRGMEIWNFSGALWREQSEEVIATLAA